jgi:hypothetical protein
MPKDPVITRDLVNAAIQRESGRDPESLTEQERFESVLRLCLRTKPPDRKTLDENGKI